MTTSIDGIICFGGEDWWYHNRGHFDMQMMREMSAHVPVLYVNSIGMRVPRPAEGRMFLTRVRRKLRSIRRGLVDVRPNFSVLSPFAVPGRRGEAITRRVLPRQIRAAARRLGINRPLVWVACPPGALVVDHLDPAAVVYQRTDRFEAFPNVDQEQIAAFDRLLRDRSDLVLYCSRLLHREESDDCRASLFVDHGVDFERFASAGRAVDSGDASAVPQDVRHLPRPRVGFIGGIDIHTFDPPLFLDVARRLPDLSFVMIGACSLPDDWCTLPNVSLLGQRPYDEVAGYMAACDVLIMPWNDSEWIRACNPVKLKEYLAAGRPVVTTPFDELANYQGFVHPASGADEFAAGIRAAIEHPDDARHLRARVERETWTAKADSVRSRLFDQGVLVGDEPTRASVRPTTTAVTTA